MTRYPLTLQYHGNPISFNQQKCHHQKVGELFSNCGADVLANPSNIQVREKLFQECQTPANLTYSGSYTKY